MINRRPSSPDPIKRKRAMIRLAQICVLLFVLLSVMHFYENFQRIAQMKQQVVDMQTRIKQLRLENERLASVVKQMDSGDYIERIAREELGLVKKGETLIITIEENGEN